MTTWDNTGDTGPNSGNSSSLLPFYTSSTNALFSTLNGAYQPVISMDVSLYVFRSLSSSSFSSSCSSCCDGLILLLVIPLGLMCLPVPLYGVALGAPKTNVPVFRAKWVKLDGSFDAT